jgi:hypothetical protein
MRATKSIRALLAGALPRQPAGSETADHATRQQKVVPAACIHNTGALGRSIAGAPENIAAYRTLDRAPCILRHDQAPHALGWREPLIRFELDRNAEPDEGSIDRDAPLGG